jgi:hypothetical protein
MSENVITQSTELIEPTKMDAELYNLFLEEFTDEEGQQFVDNFQLYLIHGTDNKKFVVDLDNIWEWLGFAKKQTPKNILTKNFIQDIDYIIKPTTDNYSTTKQILSTPFLFYFGLRPGKTAVDKFMDRFGPKGAFPSAE